MSQYQSIIESIKAHNKATKETDEAQQQIMAHLHSAAFIIRSVVPKLTNQRIWNIKKNLPQEFEWFSHVGTGSTLIREDEQFYLQDAGGERYPIPTELISGSERDIAHATRSILYAQAMKHEGLTDEDASPDPRHLQRVIRDMYKNERNKR